LKYIYRVNNSATMGHYTYNEVVYLVLYNDFQFGEIGECNVMSLSWDS